MEAGTTLIRLLPRSPHAGTAKDDADVDDADATNDETKRRSRRKCVVMQGLRTFRGITPAMVAVMRARQA